MKSSTTKEGASAHKTKSIVQEKNEASSRLGMKRGPYKKHKKPTQPLQKVIENVDKYEETKSVLHNKDQHQVIEE